MLENIVHGVLGKLDAWRDKKRGMHSALRNLNLDLTQKQKRLLLCYLDYRKADYAVSGKMAHTNIAEFMQIIREFIKRNYVIDICAHDSMEGWHDIKDIKYDFIFGMGEVFRNAALSNPEAYVIEYFTENPYWFSKQEEQKRISYFYERTGRRVCEQRTGRYYHADDEKLADGIICMGNPAHFKQCSIPIYRILPSAFKNENYSYTADATHKNVFLVLGIEGMVHKGIDILLEIFAEHKEWSLLICGKNLQQECKRLGYTLTDNITDCGFVDIKSPQFINICKSCGYMILPSCSEGASTAVETAMRHGLIPLVMKHMVFAEPASCFITFQDFSMECVERRMTDAVQMENEKYLKMSEEVYCYANNTYSLAHFTEQFRTILKRMLGAHNEDSIS